MNHISHLLYLSVIVLSLFLEGERKREGLIMLVQKVTDCDFFITYKSNQIPMIWILLIENKPPPATTNTLEIIINLFIQQKS